MHVAVPGRTPPPPPLKPRPHPRIPMACLLRPTRAHPGGIFLLSRNPLEVYVSFLKRSGPVIPHMEAAPGCFPGRPPPPLDHVHPGSPPLTALVWHREAQYEAPWRTGLLGECPGGGGGRLGINLARMCVSKSESYGSLFGFKRMK